jgi:hypothetical protein
MRRALDMGSQKGLVQRIERKLDATVEDAFARVFGGSIVPQELEAMLRREAAEGIHPLQGNRLLAPNEYIITLISLRTLSLNTWRNISANRGGKRMVMWSSGSSSRRTCVPASSAPAAPSTPTSSPARQLAISPRHNHNMRLAQNQECHE